MKIEEKDLEKIKEIAEKYDMSAIELARDIASADNNNSLHIRFSKTELKTIDEKRKKAGISRSNYCVLCFEKAVEQGLYKDINIMQVIKRGFNSDRRTERVHVSFKKMGNGLGMSEMRKMADDIGADVSALVRYFALNISL